MMNDDLEDKVNNSDLEAEIELPKEISELELLKKENEDLKNKIIYLIAENQNSVKRLKNDFEEKLKYSINKFAGDLIDPLEILFLALENVSPEHLSKGDQHLNNIHEGVNMTKSEFLKVFEKYELKRIFPLNEKFDHNFHEAVSKIPQQDIEPNIIVQVLKAGYILHGRVLRPAIVVVSC